MLFLWCRKLRKGLRKNEDGKGYVYDWRIKERWEDYPFPDNKARHTYCNKKTSYFHREALS